MVAITGESGRGKSTLLYMLGLMLKPNEGSIYLEGSPVSSLRDSLRARHRATSYGFVFQDAALDATRSVLDNVLEGSLYRLVDRKEQVGRATALLTEFGLVDRSRFKPGQVSGGQAQRISLCRALLGDPEVILADEPTGNLDAVSADVVLTALRRKAMQGGLVIFSTHDQKVVDRCDRKIEL
jgi:ABC-type lipoprotein export system ATPase subunit